MELPVVKRVPQVPKQNHCDCWDNTTFPSLKRRRSMHWVTAIFKDHMCHFNHTEIPPSDPPDNFLNLPIEKKMSAFSLTFPLKHLLLLSSVEIFAHSLCGHCTRRDDVHGLHYIRCRIMWIMEMLKESPFCWAIFNTHRVSSSARVSLWKIGRQVWMASSLTHILLA